MILTEGKKNMKRLLIITLILTFVFCVSCANQQTDTKNTRETTDVYTDDKEQAPEEDATPVKMSVKCVLKNGAVLGLWETADDVLLSLGESNEVLEAPSCVHEGNDYVYVYDGFSVTTSPNEYGINRVSEIRIDSPEYSLECGIKVGSTIAEVENEFGTDYTDSFGVISFTDGFTLISFITDNGTVRNITLSEVIF